MSGSEAEEDEKAKTEEGEGPREITCGICGTSYEITDDTSLDLCPNCGVEEGETPPEPDVECYGCGRLLAISEVEHTRREYKDGVGVPRYFCESCTEELREDEGGA